MQKVTFADVVDNTCEDCDDPVLGWNREHSLPQFPDPDCCFWGGYDEDNPLTSKLYTPWPIDLPCEGEVYLGISQVGADLHIIVDVYEGFGDTAAFVKWIIGEETTDCLDIGPIPLDFGRDWFACDWTAATCSVTT